MTSFDDQSMIMMETEPVQVQVRDNIRAVFPVGKDNWEGPIGEGLAFLKDLLANYEQMRIPLEEVHISAIFHSKASYMVLRDEAYKACTKKTEPNPNAAAIRELTEKGVSIEICSMSMAKLGIKKEDLLPEVSIVLSTFTRVIDLQMQGYGFIAF